MSPLRNIQMGFTHPFGQFITLTPWIFYLFSFTLVKVREYSTYFWRKIDGNLFIRTIVRITKINVRIVIEGLIICFWNARYDDQWGVEWTVLLLIYHWTHLTPFMHVYVMSHSKPLQNCNLGDDEGQNAAAVTGTSLEIEVRPVAKYLWDCFPRETYRNEPSHRWTNWLKVDAFHHSTGNLGESPHSPNIIKIIELFTSKKLKRSSAQPKIWYMSIHTSTLLTSELIHSIVLQPGLKLQQRRLPCTWCIFRILRSC